MNLILIAPPAAGKGTLASELNEKYNLVCNNKQTAVAVLYLQGISVYRSLIVDDNGTQCRYDDPRKLSDNYFSIELPQNEIENLRRDRYIIIKKY